MAQLEIISDGILFRNPQAGHRVVNSYLPSVLAPSESEWVGVHRRGTAFYSHDGVLAVLRSTDEGASWKEEGLVWDPRKDGTPHTYSAPFLSRLRDGTLTLSAMRNDCSDPDRLMVNAETGGFLPVETLVFRSQDNGRSWSAPQVIEMPDGIIAYVSGPVIEMQDGGWFLAFDIGKAYDDPRPVQAEMLALFSSDQGRSWGDLHRFAGISPEEQKTFWHGRVIALKSGRLFTLLWTQDLQSEKFIDLHRTTSDETGRHWDVPQPTAIPAQTSWAVDLSNGRMFAAYTVRELDPPGIRGVLSEDGGKSWDLDRNVVIWDATGRETIGIPSTDTYPASHDVIAFGRPHAAATPGGDVLVSYWCTEACVTQSRWCRLRAT